MPKKNKNKCQIRTKIIQKTENFLASNIFLKQCHDNLLCRDTFCNFLPSSWLVFLRKLSQNFTRNLTKFLRVLTASMQLKTFFDKLWDYYNSKSWSKFSFARVPQSDKKMWKYFWGDENFVLTKINSKNKVFEQKFVSFR